MKLKKRSDGGGAEPVEGTADKGKKPVVIYIMIMFIAAFLLMAWSFASHQRSNTEALGRLQSSVTAMREVQDLQDRVIALQKELAEAKQTADTLQDANETRKNAVSDLEYDLDRTQEAMDWFWRLNEAYLGNDFEMCGAILKTMEQDAAGPMRDYLTELTLNRYREIKEAVESLTEQEG